MTTQTKMIMVLVLMRGENSAPASIETAAPPPPPPQIQQTQQTQGTQGTQARELGARPSEDVQNVHIPSSCTQEPLPTTNEFSPILVSSSSSENPPSPQQETTLPLIPSPTPPPSPPQPEPSITPTNQPQPEAIPPPESITQPTQQVQADVPSSSRQAPTQGRADEIISNFESLRRRPPMPRKEPVMMENIHQYLYHDRDEQLLLNPPNLSPESMDLLRHRFVRHMTSPPQILKRWNQDCPRH
ncbi:formin-like protein 7 [Cynara cardunculus var. scolymus]|uniref:formin-like protein 7 n=1 Tax=Cynara cardunculus var. scolymus TaxID=59895 RepID=UPI000D6270BE|nr:formin-like protein 7 [Cynara cardunculus var. scolymus]